MHDTAAAAACALVYVYVVTQDHPGPPRQARQAECWSLGHEPKPPAYTAGRSTGHAPRALSLNSTSRPAAATVRVFRRCLGLAHQIRARARDMSSGCHLCRWRRRGSSVPCSSSQARSDNRPRGRFSWYDCDASARSSAASASPVGLVQPAQPALLRAGVCTVAMVGQVRSDGLGRLALRRRCGSARMAVDGYGRIGRQHQQCVRLSQSVWWTAGAAEISL